MFGNSKLKKIGSVWLFVLPAFIPLMVFWIYPILKSLYISFTDWDYMSPTYNFVFLDNFIKLFKDSRFYEALGTTVWFSIGTLFPTIAGGLLLALLLRKTFRGSGFFKFILFSPWITPTVAVSIVWTWIFNPDSGLANAVLKFFHLPALQWINSSIRLFIGNSSNGDGKVSVMQVFYHSRHLKKYRLSFTKQTDLMVLTHGSVSKM